MLARLAKELGGDSILLGDGEDRLAGREILEDFGRGGSGAAWDQQEPICSLLEAERALAREQSEHADDFAEIALHKHLALGVADGPGDHELEPRRELGVPRE